MKKWIVLAVVAVLVLAAAPLAVASHGHGHKHARGKAKFQLVGTIKENPGDGTLVVTVKAGTKTVKNALKADRMLTVAVPSTAKVREVLEDGAVTVPLSDLDVGGKVKIGGTIVDGTFTAAKVLAHRAPVPEPVVEPPVDVTPTPDPSVTPAESPAPETSPAA